MGNDKVSPIGLWGDKGLLCSLGEDKTESHQGGRRAEQEAGEVGQGRTSSLRAQETTGPAGRRGMWPGAQSPQG